MDTGEFNKDAWEQLCAEKRILKRLSTDNWVYRIDKAFLGKVMPTKVFKDLKAVAVTYLQKRLENDGCQELRSDYDTLYAIHEAAHVIVAEKLGWSANLAEIDVFYGKSRARYRVDLTKCEDALVEIERNQRIDYDKAWVLVILAGPVADLIICRSMASLTSEAVEDSDIKNAFERAEKIFNSDEECYQYLAEAFEEVVGLLWENEGIISALSELILRRRKIKRRDIDTLLKASKFERGKRWDKRLSG